MNLVSIDVSTDDDGTLVAVLSLVTDLASTEEAAALVDSIGKEFTLTPS
jgi:hypothetical protein